MSKQINHRLTNLERRWPESEPVAVEDGERNFHRLFRDEILWFNAGAVVVTRPWSLCKDLHQLADELNREREAGEVIIPLSQAEAHAALGAIDAGELVLYPVQDWHRNFTHWRVDAPRSQGYDHDALDRAVNRAIDALNAQHPGMLRMDDPALTIDEVRTFLQWIVNQEIHAG